ncbi:MAG: MATE family efflux transporter [Gammaproteobacteria bacterium]|nr:MAG: MATE family efflux transporter [Gammaproteobacteria bacterium]
MKLDSDPVGELIRRLALPASIGMVFSTLLAVTDTWYAGMMSPTALAALSLAGPLYFLVITLGIGIGQATNALVGNALGGERRNEARRFAVQAMGFSFLVSVVASIAAFIWTPAIFRLMGGESPYLEPAMVYMRVVLAGTLLFALSLVFNAILNTRGDTHSYRNAQIGAAIANAGLDPLFMFVLDLGVAGVAVATLCVQAGAAAYLFLRVRQLDFLDDFSRRELIPDWHCHREIFGQSLPNTVSMMLVAIGSIIIVRYVALFGESAMAAYGVALRIEQLMLLPVIGINIACLSLTGVNHGAGLHSRVSAIWHGGIAHAVVLMAAGGCLLLIFGGVVMRLFSSDADVQAIGTTYLHYEAFILPAYGLIFVSGSVLQGLKRPELAMYFNIVRQIIGQLLLFWLAISVFETGIAGIWLSALIINWIMAAVIVWFVRSRFLGSVHNERAPAVATENTSGSHDSTRQGEF